MRKNIPERLFKTCLALAIGQALGMAHAATIVVDSQDDVSLDDANCTLREAIISANTNPAVSTSGCVAGEVGFDTIDLTNLSEITLSQPLSLLVTDNLVINGASENSVSINGYDNAPLFAINGATVTISNATLFNGSASVYAGGIDSASGSDVTLNNLTFNSNKGVKGAAISVRSGSSLTVADSFLNGNRASNGGGGLFVEGTGSSAAIIDSTLFENKSGLESGAVFATNDSHVSVLNSTISYSNGAIHIEGSQLILQNSTVSNNETETLGAGVSIGAGGFADIQRSTLVFNGSLYGDSSSAIAVAGTGVLSIQNSILTGNNPGDPVISSTGTVTLTSHNLFGDSRATTAQAIVGLTPSNTDIVATSDGGTPTLFADIVEPLKIVSSVAPVNKLTRTSPAINQGDTSLCTQAPLSGLDQRGVALEGDCDIGSFELTTSVITVNSPATGSSAVDCTFHDAIESVTARMAAGGCVAGADANTILFDPLTFPSSNDNRIVLTETVRLRNHDLAVYGQGNPGLTLDANNSGQVFYGYKSTLKLSDLVVTGGSQMFGSGGGISVLDSRLTVINSMITGNTIGSAGGGIYAANSSVLVDSTTVSDNESDFGGGIRIRKSAGLTDSIFELRNSTVSGNSGRLFGGGLALSRSSSISILNSTITDNTAQEGGGIYFLNSTNRYPSIINSIISGNDALVGAEITAPSAVILAPDQSNIFGDSAHSSAEAFNSFSPSINSFNLTFDAGNSKPISSILKPLADNGGVGLTHELPSSSPALNAANQSVCQQDAVMFDQRGVKRDEKCDIGAIESIQDESGDCFVGVAKNGAVFSICL